MKKIYYWASAQKDIENFPPEAKRVIVQLLSMVSDGLDLQPNDFEGPMSVIGSGVYELRIKMKNFYRVFYVTKFDKAVYVLHAFVKKTAQTSKKDVEKGRERYKTLQRYRQK